MKYGGKAAALHFFTLCGEILKTSGGVLASNEGKRKLNPINSQEVQIMSLKGRFLSVVALSVAVGAFGTMASAQETTQKDTQKQEKRDGWGKHKDGDRGGFGMHGGRRGGMMGLKELDLTDAQKQQIHSLMESNRPDQATMEEMRTLGQAKRDGTITAAQESRLKELRDQGRQKREAMHQQLLAILTPEQRAKFELQQKENRERWQQHRQMRDQDKSKDDKPTDN
jgi:protein CpxP